MVRKILVLVSLMVSVASLNANEFIIKKQTAENVAGLSKDALKERMGEAVRDSMHALLDSAQNVVQAQRAGAVPLTESCALHDKIIALQRKLSRVAESLIDSHFVYKKNHKKRLEASLNLLRTCAQECKDASTKLQAKTELEQRKNVDAVTVKFAALESKLSTDVCLRAV
jgi:hypothetical protein